mmetsp:Transcript_37648/g.86934  ORF Transcript_37648/g.86934 Transcript_37648/m.86934 type:complete len:440 (+) Transcript_37648:58-1377(+)
MAPIAAHVPRRPRGTQGLVLIFGAAWLASHNLFDVAFTPSLVRAPSLRIATCRAAASSVDEDIAPTPLAEASVFILEQDVVTGEPDTAGLPSEMGVYAVFDEASVLRYVGLTRQLDKSIRAHAKSIGVEEASQLISSVYFHEMPGSTKDQLKGTWERWIKDHMDGGGDVPAGNLPDSAAGADPRWRSATSTAKPALTLGGGRGLVDVEEAKEAVGRAVKQHPILLFMKGTPVMPQCGFSARAVGMLRELGVKYESIDVMDAVGNPFVRDAVKEYSSWPTIPQFFVNGELVGGTDIMTEMYENGQLEAKVLQAVEEGASQQEAAGAGEGTSSADFERGQIELVADDSRPVASKLSKLLSEEFDLYGLRIIDETAQHEGDAQALAMGLTSESHFRVEVIAPDFDGLSPVQRQKKVFDSLGDTMNRIHALSLVTRTPAEVSA